MKEMITAKDLSFITSRTKELLSLCVAETPDGIKVYRPDCSGRYPAVWTRDFAYMVEYAGDLFDPQDIKKCLEYIISNAHAEEGWIPDWVRADGTVTYGFNRCEFPKGPLLDNGPFLVIAVDEYLKIDKENADLNFEKWCDTLCRGLDWLTLNSDGLITVAEDDLHVGYGFTDTIKKTGALAMESLLLWRAARILSERLKPYGKDGKYRDMADRIEASFLDTFSTDSGMILAATGRCKKIDVWASCYMLSIGFPVAEERRRSIAKWLTDHYSGIVEHGQVRHLKEGEYWDSVYLDYERDTYQNGAFWPVASGWLYDALKDHNESLALETIRSVLDYYEKYGIFECVCGEYRKLDGYVVSATNVYDTVKRILRS